MNCRSRQTGCKDLSQLLHFSCMKAIRYPFQVQYYNRCLFVDLISQHALYEEKLAEARNTLLAAQYNSRTGHLELPEAKTRLEMLRKGCCHPQILDTALARSVHVSRTAGRKTGSSNTKTGVAAGEKKESSGPRPLDEIMVIKVEQSRQICEERQRSVLFHLFAMAGAVALQAQCGILGIAGATSTDANSSGGGGGDGVAIHLAKAHCLYQLALQLIRANRRGTVLVAMVRVSSEGQLRVLRDGGALLPVTDSAGVVVPHTQMGLNLVWNPDPVPSAVFGTSPAMLAWVPLSSASLTPPAYTGACTDGQDVPVSATLGAVAARLVFTSGRRLTALRISANTSLVQTWLQTHTTFAEETESSALSSSSESAKYRYLVVLLPATVVLQVGLGSSDTYVNVHTAHTHSTNINGEGSGLASAPNAPRSKRWQVCVTALQAQCCLVRCPVNSSIHSNGSNGRHSSTAAAVLCSWLPTASVSAVVRQLRGDASTDIVDVQLGLSVQLLESAIDADALQELHVCHNITTLSGLLSSPAERQAYLQQVCVLSQTVPIEVERKVGAALRGLQAVTTLGAMSAVSQGIDSAERVCVVEGQLQSAAQRATAIESEVRIYTLYACCFTHRQPWF